MITLQIFDFIQQDFFESDILAKLKQISFCFTYLWGIVKIYL